MPLPISPQDVKDTIPSPGGNFCEKFIKSLKLPKLVYDIVSYIWNEDGSFTDDFKADICAAGCLGGGGPSTGGLAAPAISASDGQYADKIEITWASVTGALLYDLYRSNTNDVNTATPLVVGLQTTSYQDSAITPGQYYYYWAKARNNVGASAFSNGDRGHAGSIATTLAAVTDLVAGQGIRLGPPSTPGSAAGTIALVFTPVSGAETYDFYRNTIDDFATATKIDADRAPYDNSNSFTLGPTPYFVDNVGELLYLHDPSVSVLNYYTKFYFWVVAKRSGPPLQSAPSNGGLGALGWSAGRGDATVPIVSSTIVDGGSGGTAAAIPYTVQSGTTKVWFALTGAGAGGAGGGTQYGGGGAGAGPVITGWIPVVTGAKFRIKSTPDSNGTGNAAGTTNGAASSTTKLQYSANGTWSDVIDLVTTNAAGGGVYNGGGSGAGGAGSTGTKHGSVQEGAIYVGRAGKAGNADKGGRSGYPFGSFRHLAGSTNGNGSQSNPAGSGGNANPITPSLRTGGAGVNGSAFLVAYAT